MTKITTVIAAAFAAFAMVGCGGSGETVLGVEQNPRIRAVNAVSSVTPLNVRVSDRIISTNGVFGTVTGYEIFENGNRSFEAIDSDTSGVVSSNTQLFELSEFYSIIAFEEGTGVGVERIRDDRSVPSGVAQLRVIHLASGTGNVDVFVTAPGADITTSAPTVANVPFKTLSGDLAAYRELTPGTYRIRVTPAGTPGTVAIDQTLALADGTSRTLFVVRGGAGTPVTVETNDRA